MVSSEKENENKRDENACSGLVYEPREFEKSEFLTLINFVARKHSKPKMYILLTDESTDVFSISLSLSVFKMSHMTTNRTKVLWSNFQAHS